MSDVDVYPSGEKVTISFLDGSDTFHSQWLRDSQMENRPYKLLNDTFTYNKASAEVKDAFTCGKAYRPL